MSAVSPAPAAPPRMQMRPVLLALVSGVLYFLAFPPVGAWPLAFVALVPLLVALGGRRPLHAALLGLISGSVTAVAGFYWLMPMLLQFSGMPAAVCALLLLLLGLWQGGRMALSAWLHARAARGGWPEALAFPLALVAGEALYPLLFPWFLGCALVPAPVIAQVADLGGPILLTLLLAVSNTAIALWLRPGRVRARTSSIAAVAAWVASIAYGAWRIARIDQAVSAAPRSLVGLVQGNIPMDISGADAYRDAFRRQTQASRALVAKGASWIVWSESAFLYPVPESDAERFLADGLTRSLGRPAILGALVYRNEGGGDRTFNSALVTDSQGRLRGRYDKHHLLAFGEYLPFGETFPILYRLSPASGRITPGDGFSPLDIDGHRVAVLICYEDILPGFVREAVQATSPELLVDVTNDAWFGPTAEPELHLALARLRAIEHRTFLVRAANTGVTSVVDPAGRVVARAPLFESASLLAEVRWFKSPTVFERVGGFPWWFAAGVAFGLAWLPRSKLRSGRRGHRLASPRS